ncbi:hypothetical protein CC80DRAFT_489564 [Byssothecium circinans]|uniref:superoxide dismutase n=1 Tax=Byssothecium circinans TaxID=147558 RepID=A0A6A5U675_9PLEO|nr:hypothetical protein CC80DRAFT_489564 [Byssothecium circinans]
MRTTTTTTATILTLLTTLTLTNATPAEPKLAAENPPNAILTAELPDTKTSTIRGTVTLQTAAKDSVGVDGTVTLKGLPKEGGPFIYHIHAAAVPADGNCTATGGHLDPMQAGTASTYKCDAKNPQWCEIGDLSGKYGAVEAGNGEFSAKWTDRYISTNANEKDYAGKLSVVIHSADKKRLACANFVVKSGGAAANGTTLNPGNGTHVNTGPTPTTSPGGQPSSAAQKVAAGAGALVFAAAALFL